MVVDPIETADRAETDIRASETTRTLRRLQSTMSDAESAMAHRLGLNRTDLAAMTHLTFTTRAMGPRELSSRLGITPGATTELVDRLERAGHLERRRDAADRRRIELHPSPTALTRVAGELTSLLVRLEAIAGDLDPVERTVVDRYLTAVLAAYESFAADA